MLRKISLSVVLLGIASGVWAQTYYRDSPGASDASKIATEMLNDAASGRFRNQSFSRPYNPFDRMIEDYENSKRARAAEMERWAAECERTRGQREAEERYQQQVMQENARRRAEAEARQRRADALRNRVEELRGLANRSDASAHLELGILVQEGKYEPGVLTFPAGMTPMAWVKQRYDQAQTLGSELAVVAVGSLAQADSPSFAVLWNSVHALTTAEAKREHLRSLADQGHLGANLWLGGWYSGRRVGLGLLPTADRGPEARGQALQSLDRARKKNFLHAGTWYAETLLSGDPTPAERAEAREVLERLLAPGSERDLAAAPALARELLRNARVEADLVRPRALLGELEKLPYVTGLAAVGGVHVQGLDGEFHPGLAARAYGRIPWVGERAGYQVSEELWAGIDAWIGIDSKRDPRAAVDHFRKARMLAGLFRGGVLPEHRLLKVEVELWLAFVQAELGLTDPAMPDPLQHLKDQTRDDQRLGHLLSACAELGDRRTSAMIAGNIWSFLNLQALLSSPLPPVETWLVLQCVVRCHERGGLPEAAPWVDAIRALSSNEVPIRGPALLAKLYFTQAHPRDVADRAGISGVYAPMVRAAWRDPELWRHVAALVEVLQLEPLSREQWKSGWLAPFLENHPGASEDQKRWAEQLIQPTLEGDQALERLAARHPGPKEAELPDVQAAHTSIQLRYAARNAQARSAFERLVALGKAGSWHAQAMLEDFSVRYRPGYVARNDLPGFRRDAREAAELVAD